MHIIPYHVRFLNPFDILHGILLSTSSFCPNNKFVDEIKTRRATIRWVSKIKKDKEAQENLDSENDDDDGSLNEF